MKSKVCPTVKSMFWLIVLVTTVDCRSHFKLHSKQLEQAQTELPNFTGESQRSDETTEWSETTEKIVTHPEAIIMNNDDTKDSKDTLGFEMNNPNKVAAGELYQSDMLLTDDQWAALRARKAIDNEDMRWTEGSDGNPLVPYLFQDAVNQDDVQAGLDHWMEHTCIKFEETTNTDQPHLQFHIGSGCWSNVGMLYWRDGQQISIGSGCNSVGTVVHEVGHAMGFFHEQSRADRDGYVTVLWENLADNSQSVVNFGKEVDNNYSVPYDYTSVMHYGKAFFSINNNPTLVTNDILDIGLLGRKDGLSHRDKLLANKMYNCIGKWLNQCGLSSDPCTNDGYTGKDCTCVCPPGTSGSNCEEIVGDYYATPGCGGVFSSSTGTIRHPLNGDGYGDNEHCLWTINAAVPIRITFTSFDAETNYDYLYIRDGENTESPLAGNFTGDDVPSPVLISTNEAYLVFSSDRSTTKDGFELQWEPSGADPPTTQPPMTQPSTTPPTTVITTSPTTDVTDFPSTTPSGCGGEYTASSGSIRHPLSGSSYENNENCVWSIRTGNRIKLTFISFDLENNYDDLYIRDGDSIDSTVLGNFTGSTLPSPVEANSGEAYLLFTSDHSVTRTGFVLQWETLGTGPSTTPSPTTETFTTQPPSTVVSDPPSTTTAPSGCGGEYTASSGSIRHPLSGSSYGNDDNCVWSIRTGSSIKIIFLSFDLENSYDYLYIRDGDSIDSTSLGDFTGSTLPSPVDANSGEAYLQFTSDGSVTSAGFVLRWETLGTGPSTTSSPTTEASTTQPPTTVVSDPPSTTTAPSVCDGSCSFSSGTIHYPSNGDNYQNNEYFVWVMKAESTINIDFISFSTETNYDFLYVRDGGSLESPVLGNFTGSSLPSSVVARSGSAYLLFTSDHSVTSTGFEIQWNSTV